MIIIVSDFNNTFVNGVLPYILVVESARDVQDFKLFSFWKRMVLARAL